MLAQSLSAMAPLANIEERGQGGLNFWLKSVNGSLRFFFPSTVSQLLFCGRGCSGWAQALKYIYILVCCVQVVVYAMIVTL